jgi:hypothetical protein
VFVEEVFVDLCSGDDFSAMEGEEFEERIFAGSERDRDKISSDRFGVQVDGELSDLDDGGRISDSASDKSAKACAKFSEVKGFREVIVSAAVEAADAVIDLVAGGKDEDGNRVGLTELLQEFPAVEFGKQKIEDDGIVGPGAGFVESFFAVGSLIHSKAVLAQHLSDGAQEIRFVFDHENTHGFFGEERSGQWAVGIRVAGK